MVSDAYSGHAYDDFLFESLGVEDNGMDLSVLSALARAGVDPWSEAKRLAGLPRQAAISAILSFAGDVETARRLAELLPRNSAAAAAPSEPLSPKYANRERLFRKYGLLVIIACLAIVVAFMMYDGRARSLTPSATPAGVPITQH
jgi:hypothetical protein